MKVKEGLSKIPGDLKTQFGIFSALGVERKNLDLRVYRFYRFMENTFLTHTILVIRLKAR